MRHHSRGAPSSPYAYRAVDEPTPIVLEAAKPHSTPKGSLASQSRISVPRAPRMVRCSSSSPRRQVAKYAPRLRANEPSGPSIRPCAAEPVRNSVKPSGTVAGIATSKGTSDAAWVGVRYRNPWSIGANPRPVVGIRAKSALRRARVVTRRSRVVRPPRRSITRTGTSVLASRSTRRVPARSPAHSLAFTRVVARSRSRVPTLTSARGGPPRLTCATSGHANRMRSQSMSGDPSGGAVDMPRSVLIRRAWPRTRVEKTVVPRAYSVSERSAGIP